MAQEVSRVDVLLGLQWGDEGKGKVVDALASSYGVVARFQGGPNAGHSLEFDGRRFVLHTIPSGIFHPGTLNVIGNGVVLDPGSFLAEVTALQGLGVDTRAGLRISSRAHVILPTHRALDAQMESARGAARIGATLKGIGPTYTDKTSRHGLRVGDLEAPDLRARYEALRDRHIEMMGGNLPEGFDLEAEEARWFEGVASLLTHTFCDAEFLINGALDSGLRVLAEGAQGTMLDVDFGSYPYVTSSSTVCAGACLGLGVSPRRIGRVYGVFKAYCTRVGAGPFPTEETGEIGGKLREWGHEYGATTGRARRCGWLDLVALRYAVMLNGVTDLVMTKGDVLTGLDRLRMCTGYTRGGARLDAVPFSLEGVAPIYEEFPGWGRELRGVPESWEKLPEALRSYIEYVEGVARARVSVLSLGPDRAATLHRGEGA